jgi:hypothetical protein
VTLRARGAGVPDATVSLQLTVTAAPALALTSATGALALTRGVPATTTLTLARPTGVAGPVSVTVAAPAGVTATATPNPIPADAAAATLTVTADATAGAGELVVTASGVGAQSARLAIPYTVAAASGYTLAVSPSPVLATAGGAPATATVTLARSNFAGAVTLAAAGAPAGLTVQTPTAPVDGLTAALTVQAAATVPAGDYPITVTGTTAGLAPVTATFAVRVAAASPTEGMVTGVALDARGRPIANAKVGVKMVFNPNVVWTRTGADGRYTVRGLAAGLSHQAWAWHEVEYGSRSYCVRLAMPNVGDYGAFVPGAGAVRDFRWQLTGRIPDAGNNHFGATVSLALGSEHFFEPVLEDGDDVEVRLTPEGPLVDGSEGSVVTRTVRFSNSGWDSRLLDIPHGIYTAQATRVRGGVRTALRVGRLGANRPAATTTVAWEPEHSPGSCGQVLGPDLLAFSLQLSRP